MHALIKDKFLLLETSIPYWDAQRIGNLKEELSNLHQTFKIGSAKVKQNIMQEFHSHLFLFHRPKSNQQKEHWSDKAFRTARRKRADRLNKKKMAKKTPPANAAVQKEIKEKVNFKEHINKLTSNIKSQSAAQITRRNLDRMVIRNKNGGVKKILKAKGLLLEYPEGVDKLEYKKMLDGEVSFRTSARKSTAQKRRKPRFGKRARENL